MLFQPMLPSLICLPFLLASTPPVAPREGLRAKEVVEEAVAFAEKEGTAALVREINQGTGRFNAVARQETYLFIYDFKGTCVAIGYGTGRLVGTNRWDMKDPQGRMVIQEFVRVAQSKEGQGWVRYIYPNPLTHKNQTKLSYVHRLGDWVVGSGVYLPD